MRKIRACTRVTCATSVLALLVFPCADALASSGEFTSAQANADWTLGAVAGSASWGDCQHIGGCRLQPFVTVGTSACSSAERRWPHSNDHLTLAWSGAEYRSAGSESFDVSDIPLSGEPGQLACLTLLETYEERPYCQLHPEPGIACPQWILQAENPTVLGEAMLTQALSAPNEPPTIGGEAVLSVTATDATLEAEIDPRGASAGVFYQFQLLLDPGEAPTELACPSSSPPGYSVCAGPQDPTALPLKWVPGNAATTVSLDLASVGVSLDPGRTYYFRVLAADRLFSEDTAEWQSPAAVGPSEEFATPPAPSIVGESASGVTSSESPSTSKQADDASAPPTSSPVTAPSIALPLHHRHRRHHRRHGLVRHRGGRHRASEVG
jgi:hypothetical protein